MDFAGYLIEITVLNEGYCRLAVKAEIYRNANCAATLFATKTVI